MKILLIAYNNDSYIHWFPCGLAYIAAHLRSRNYDVNVYHQDIYHFPDCHLTNFLNNNHYDIVAVGMSGGYYHYQKLLKISEAINSSIDRPFYIIGGHCSSPEPEYFLEKTQADVVVIGEGEITMAETVEAVESNRSLSMVKGIAYREGGNVCVNEHRDLIEDIDSISYPAWDLFPIDHYALLREPNIKNNERCFPVVSGRGCNFSCNFCYRLDKGLRLRSPENVVEEIRILKKRYNISYITFVDELFMSSPQRTIEMSEAFIKAELNIKWNCQGRLNFAYLEVLNIMKKSGCVFIGYGVECMDNEILKVMRKGLTTTSIIKGVEHTLKAGISPGLYVMFGNIGENKKTLKATTDFLLKYDDHSQLRTIRPLTPYPGSPIYDYAIEKGLLEGPEDFYERKHLNSDLLAVNFTDLTDKDFYKYLFRANKRLLRKYFDDKVRDSITSLKKLYFEKDVNFRGFRHT